MKTQLIKLEKGNVIVSDEPIKEDDLFIDLESFEILTCQGFAGGQHLPKAPVCNGVVYPNTEYVKKIVASDFHAELPNIDYNGLEEELGIFKTALVIGGIVESETSFESLEEYRENCSLVLLGFKKAEELNKKNLRGLLSDFYVFATEGEVCKYEVIEGFLNYLFTPETIDVETEIVGNTIKITNLL